MQIRLVLFTTLLGVSAIVSVVPVVAETSAVVDATIIPKVISVKIPGTCPSSVNYTSVPLGATSRDPDGVPTLCAENNGSGKEDFEIRGADANSVGGNKWTLESSAGVNQYVHKYAVVEGGTVGTFTPLTKNQADNEWANDVPVGEQRQFRLRMDTPTESSSYEERTTTVTVIATDW